MVPVIIKAQVESCLALPYIYIMICAAYRLPSTQRSFWKKELYQLLDCALSLCDE